ncbi:hypothetical protein [Halorussus aquaticus]|uniref:Uncharacterized protein n=1 Tax=Halorussus aquaticus TaxID=2953748 RepID=A0ABD5Q829_9EURY|nr:hypothetical protein [Halorussus aquaticus]
MTAPNAKHTITDEGSEFLNDLCEAWSGERSELQELVEEHGLQLFTGGGGARAIVPFPDEYITEFYFDDWEHETFYVAKICGIPSPQNYREVEIWNRVYGNSDADLFAPVDAWDDKYRWLLMKRVTPVSPISGDLPYIGNGQEYYVDSNAPERIEGWLEDEGWHIEDAPENIGFHEEREYPCLFDYGGVHPVDGEIEYPDWLQAAVDDYNH